MLLSIPVTAVPEVKNNIAPSFQREKKLQLLSPNDYSNQGTAKYLYLLAAARLLQHGPVNVDRVVTTSFHSSALEEESFSIGGVTQREMRQMSRGTICKKNEKDWDR